MIERISMCVYGGGDYLNVLLHGVVPKKRVDLN